MASGASAVQAGVGGGVRKKMRARGRPHRTLTGLTKASGLYPKEDGVLLSTG